MHLIVTRTFPPEVGGMQNLMYGLAKSLSENVMIKVFADQHPNQDNFDKELSFSIWITIIFWPTKDTVLINLKILAPKFQWMKPIFLLLIRVVLLNIN